MNRPSCAALIVIALIASAAGLATTGTPAGQPGLSGALNLLCTPQILWCEGMKAEFQKVYPKVTVEFVRLSSGEDLGSHLPESSSQLSGCEVIASGQRGFEFVAPAGGHNLLER